MSGASETRRRHDIDALRVLAFALVILYHVGMVYVAGWHWHVKSPRAAAWLQAPMAAVNLWRLDLVFLVSGIALAFLTRSRPARELLRERSVRLLLPLAFGMVVIVPYQAYAQARAGGHVPPGFGAFLLRYATLGPWPADAFDGARPGITWNHLWYLAYLWLYTAVLLAALPLLRSGAGLRLQAMVLGLRGWGLLLLPAVPLVAATLALRAVYPPTHDLVHDAWLHATYGWMLLLGWWIGGDAGVWAALRALRWRTAGLAMALLLALWLGGSGALQWPWSVARGLEQVYAWMALCAVAGWAHRWLDRPWPWLPWAQEQVYPWYVLHQTLLIALVVAVTPWALEPVLEPLVLVGGTVAGCWLLTAGIRRSNLLRPLFGLKRFPAKRVSAAQTGS